MDRQSYSKEQTELLCTKASFRNKDNYDFDGRSGEIRNQGWQESSRRILKDSKELIKINRVHYTKQYDNLIERDEDHKRFHRNM